MENFNKHAPCLDKNCSFCCDPVKINQRAIRSCFESPKDKDGNKIWKETIIRLFLLGMACVAIGYTTTLFLAMGART